jgi:hypothetical protein
MDDNFAASGSMTRGVPVGFQARSSSSLMIAPMIAHGGRFSVAFLHQID